MSDVTEAAYGAPDDGTNGEPEFTGKFIVLLDPDDPQAGIAALADGAGVSIESGELASDEVTEAMAQGGGVVLSDIGVAVLAVDPEQAAALMEVVATSPHVLAVEREQVMRVLTSADFLLGYRAGVDSLVEQLLGETNGLAPAAEATWDESRYTWGLQAIRATEVCRDGNAVKLAVLDTGVDLGHRDLAGRALVTASFISGEEVQDGHGHGTHCIGTAAGTARPSTLPRYGIASGALIHAGKVLSNQGSGADGGILAGIDWALSQGCRVISMSLGSRVNPGGSYSRVYEGVARRCLAAGTIIVAAAGNDSQRPGQVSPVSRPANCPSILAVGALTESSTVAGFSNAGLNPEGGQVDIAAPGANVLSAWPEPTGYRRLNGTSMATPHVAGVIALLAEAAPDATAAELINRLLSGAARLPLPSADVGAGLLQATSSEIA